MNTHEICSEEQAIALAGVSARTLQRFRESGYLTATPSKDGAVTYIRSQLLDIFGGTDSQPDSSNDAIDQPLDLPPHETLQYTRKGSASNSEVTPPSTTEEQPNTQSPNTDVSKPTASGSYSPSDIEIERLRNVLAIQERMLDAKDDEIADLKNQRAWLRQRVEKLEEKSDRDQILLLQETQTIRSLISYQESRKSPFRQLLEWMGIAESTVVSALPQPSGSSKPPASAAGSRTIEVQKASNGD